VNAERFLSLIPYKSYWEKEAEHLKKKETEINKEMEIINMKSNHLNLLSKATMFKNNVLNNEVQFTKKALDELSKKIVY